MARLTDRARNDLNVLKGRKIEIKPIPNPVFTVSVHGFFGEYCVEVFVLSVCM